MKSTQVITKADTQALYDAVCALIRLLTVSDKTFAPAGGQMKYNGLDFQSIGFVGRNPGCMASELAKFLGVAATTATSTVDRLVKRGLINRTRPEENRRSVALHLSKTGITMFQVMVDHDMASMQLMLDALEKNERLPFVNAMTKIARKFEHMNSDSPTH
jgi:DNA-binding MarR family transcriptional regulator